MAEPHVVSALVRKRTGVKRTIAAERRLAQLRADLIHLDAALVQMDQGDGVRDDQTVLDGAVRYEPAVSARSALAALIRRHLYYLPVGFIDRVPEDTFQLAKSMRSAQVPPNEPNVLIGPLPLNIKPIGSDMFLVNERIQIRYPLQEIGDYVVSSNPRNNVYGNGIITVYPGKFFRGVLRDGF